MSLGFDNMSSALPSSLNNDEIVPKVNHETLDHLQQVALQNIGELEGLDLDQTSINQASNDEPPKHTKHQVYWYLSKIKHCFIAAQVHFWVRLENSPQTMVILLGKQFIKLGG